MESTCESSICKTLDECVYLNWRNPRVSGAILGLTNLFFLTMYISKLNVFVLGAYLFLFYVISSVVVAQFMTKTEKDDNEYEHVSKETVEKYLKMVYETFYALDVYMKQVASLSNIGMTIKFFVGIYAFMTVSAWFNETFMIWLAINALFAWKPVVNSQKEKIEKVKGTVYGVISKAVSTVDAFIPKYKEPIKKD